MMQRNAVLLVLTLAGSGLIGCSTYKTGGGADTEASLEPECQGAVERFQTTDPGIKRFFDSAYGYAMFPKITKGGVGIGAAGGEGLVYEQGRIVGYDSMSQVTIGAQLGGQTYSEVIFFQDQAACESFKSANFEFSAQASAVAAEDGAAATADFQSGLAGFTLVRGGLMFEASIGGQRFRYHPKSPS